MWFELYYKLINITLVKSRILSWLTEVLSIIMTISVFL